MGCRKESRIETTRRGVGAWEEQKNFVSNKYVGVDVANISSRVTWYCGGSS